MCTKRNVVSVALSEIDRSFVLARESVPSLGITLMGNYTRTWLCIVLSLEITSATDQSKHTIHCCRFIREETATTTPFGDIHHHGSLISEVVVRWPDHDDCQTDQSPSRELGITHSKPPGNKGEGRGWDQARRRRRDVALDRNNKVRGWWNDLFRE